MEEEKNNIDETIDKVAELINEASISQKDSIRLSNLKHVQELIIHKYPDLLDNFLDEVLQFQLDKSSEVKKFIVSFIEEACKRDNETIFKLIDNFRYLLFDENVNVQKRAYLAMINIFKNTIKYISKRRIKSFDQDKMQTWLSMIDIKDHIAAQLDSDNDGIRTSAIKFLEMLIICYSPRIKESLIPSANQFDFSIDQINTQDDVLLNKQLLQEEGRNYMRKLLEYTLSTHISSVNLISSICVLSNIAKQRPEFMETVLETYFKLLSNMPPTLGQSQVNTVKKQIKLQIISICKNPCCVEFQSQIVQLLNDLNCSINEINRILPKNINSINNNNNNNNNNSNSASSSSISSTSDFKKRLLSTNQQLNINNQKDSKEFLNQEPLNKKQKLSSSSININSNNSSISNKEEESNLPSQDQIVDDLVQKLQNKDNLADLVLVSMAFLPEQLTPSFKQSYKAISNAGTYQQIKHLARLLSNLFLEANLIKFKTEIQLLDDEDDDDDDDEEEDDDDDEKTFKKILKTEKIEITPLICDLEKKELTKPILTKKLPPPPSLISSSASTTTQKQQQQKQQQQQSSQTSNKTFKLNEISLQTKLNDLKLNDLFSKSYKRILESNETILNNKQANLIRKKILIESSKLNEEYDSNLLDYIFQDVKKRIDLAILWIFKNYINLKQTYFKLNITKSNDQKFEKEEEEEEKIIENERLKLEFEYDRVLNLILYNLQQRPEQKDLLFSKVICQVPYLSENCLNLLKNSCQDEQKFYFNMSTLSELIVTRFKQRCDLLEILLEFTHNRSVMIRENAILITLNLYERKEFTQQIEQFALQRLDYLKLPSPPEQLFKDLAATDEYTSTETIQWQEETIKNCLYLYLDLMSIKHNLIHHLSQVYINSISEIKRVILKMLENPIKKMTMDSIELLKLIQDFPHNSETLVLRIIHILTEKQQPSIDLVNKVRNLYATKLPDVRFLIPILNGLTKAEIIAALPQLIKLSQAVVKEVFNRLLGINVGLQQQSTSTTHKSPISPAELLVALHQIDSNICDLKTIINATSLCFSEKQIYTQEVLASVMQQLIDVTPIPTLYMRTVIQSVSMYPKLSSFVLVMMQRLIGKQIWKQPKVWEGFVKCCQRIKPISHQILLQLPPQQLKEVFQIAQDLKEHVCKHVQQMTPIQKAQITTEVMEIIEQQNI